MVEIFVLGRGNEVSSMRFRRARPSQHVTTHVVKPRLAMGKELSFPVAGFEQADIWVEIAEDMKSTVRHNKSASVTWDW